MAPPALVLTAVLLHPLTMPPSAPALPCSWIMTPSAGGASTGECRACWLAAQECGAGLLRFAAAGAAGLFEKGSHDWAACACLPNHMLRCPPACLSCSATLVWTALPPQGRLTDSASLGHNRGGAPHCVRCSLPNPCQRSQPALLCCGPSPQIGPRLWPQHYLYITCTCILYVPFHNSSNASVALLICSLASRRCSSRPPTAPGWQRAVCCRCLQGAQHSGRGQPGTTPPHWLARRLLAARVRAVSSAGGWAAAALATCPAAGGVSSLSSS